MLCVLLFYCDTELVCSFHSLVLFTLFHCATIVKFPASFLAFTLTVLLSLLHCSHNFHSASCVIIRSFSNNTVIDCLLVLSTRCLCSRQGELPVARPQHPRTQGASGDPTEAAAPESRPGRRTRSDP